MASVNSGPPRHAHGTDGAAASRSQSFVEVALYRADIDWQRRVTARQCAATVPEKFPCAT